MPNAQLKILNVNSVREIHLQARENINYMFYDKRLSLICAYSVKGRKCESNARYTDGSPVHQCWNILTSDWKFIGLTHSLEYVLALLPEFLRDNI